MNGCITAATGLSTLPSLFPSRTPVKMGVVSVYNDLCPLPEALSIFLPVSRSIDFVSCQNRGTNGYVITPTGHSTLSSLFLFFFSL